MFGVFLCTEGDDWRHRKRTYDHMRRIYADKVKKHFSNNRERWSGRMSIIYPISARIPFFLTFRIHSHPIEVINLKDRRTFRFGTSIEWQMPLSVKKYPKNEKYLAWLQDGLSVPHGRYEFFFSNIFSSWELRYRNLLASQEFQKSHIRITLLSAHALNAE